MIKKIKEIWKVGKLYVQLSRAGLDIFEMFKLTDGRIGIRVAPSMKPIKDHSGYLSGRLMRSDNPTSIIEIVDGLIAQSDSMGLMTREQRANATLGALIESAGFTVDTIQIESDGYGMKWVAIGI